MNLSHFSVSLSTFATVTALGLTLSLGAGCTRNHDVSQTLIHPLDDGETILEYKGGKITAGDVKARMAPRFEKVRESLLNDYIREAGEVLVESKKGQIGNAPGPEVSDYELDSYLKQNHVPPSEKEKIREFLIGEKKRLFNEEARRTLFESLNVQNKLGTAHFKVDEGKSAPQLGGEKATLSLQLFCDFANPLCNRARLVIAATRNRFADQIRWTYHFFPVASNPGSYEAAIFALCAQDQGQFWEAHDRLLDNAPAVAKKDFAPVLAELKKVDAEKLKACLKSEDAAKRIDKEVKAASDLGLNATPVYFVGDEKFEDADQIMPALEARLVHK